MREAPNSPIPLTAERSPWLRGPIRLPGDPTQSHLALLLAAMARGESVLENLSPAASVAPLTRALLDLGVHISGGPQRRHVQGIGVGGFLAPTVPIDLAGSGDAALLLLGLLAAHDFDSRVTGFFPDAPTTALLDYFARNGTRIDRGDGVLTTRAPRFGIPLDATLTPETAVLATPLLLHALVLEGRSALRLPPGPPDPAEALLRLFGAKLAMEQTAGETRLTLTGMAPLRAQALVVPGDPGLAVYPAVAALIAPDSEITITSVALAGDVGAPLGALRLLGGDIALGAGQRPGTVDIVVRHGPLVGTVIPADLGIARDDYPILAVAAAFASGETLFPGLGEGGHRSFLTQALRNNGIECFEQPGGLMVRGRPRVPGGGNVATALDPRLAMSFLVLGMGADRPVTIDDGAPMAGIFPDFVPAFEHVGASFSTGVAP